MVTLDRQLLDSLLRTHFIYSIPITPGFDFIAFRYRGLRLAKFSLNENSYFTYNNQNVSEIARLRYVLLYYGRYWIAAVSF